jgi:tetratricopeptide (TPR) repeat protein
MFKLGRYAEADALYSSALDVLPDKHLLRVPLYNNRALAKIRCGDHSGAVEDCTAVLEIIGTDYHPAREAKVTREECGAGVDIGTALAKAYRRRAEAYEGREKWELARKDWEAVVGLDWVGKERSDAVNGVTRCRKMEKLGKQPDADDAGARSSAGINDFAISQASPPPRKPASVPKPRVTKSAPTETFEAVTALRAANAQLEAEDALRHELKDRVDARLGAWKSGKETNLRALLASLDNVLWPELGWKNVGMAELVANTQVKVRYTKAIAKVHPDKVSGLVFYGKKTAV